MTTSTPPVGGSRSASELPPAIPTEEQAVWTKLLELYPEDKATQLFLRYQACLNKPKADKPTVTANVLNALGEKDPSAAIKRELYDWDTTATPPELSPLTPEQKAGQKTFGDSYADLEKDYQARRAFLKDQTVEIGPTDETKEAKKARLARMAKAEEDLANLDRNYAAALSSGKPKDVKRALSSVPLKDDSGATVPVPTVELTPEAEEKKEKGSLLGKLDKIGTEVDEWAGRVDKGMGWIEKGRNWLGKNKEQQKPSTDASEEKGGMMSRIAQALTALKGLFQKDKNQANQGSNENSAGSQLAQRAAGTLRTHASWETRKKAEAEETASLAQAHQANTQGDETEHRTDEKKISDLYKTDERIA